MEYDYAETLRRWRRSFHAAESTIDSLGYDARFRRMWDYYLAYCEVGFDSGITDLIQAVYQVPEDGARPSGDCLTVAPPANQ